MPQAQYSILAVVLPNGTADKFYKFSVVLYPRLFMDDGMQGEVFLAAFESTFLADWSKLAQSRFEIIFGDSSAEVAFEAIPERQFARGGKNSEFDPQLWSDLLVQNKEWILVRNAFQTLPEDNYTDDKYYGLSYGEKRAFLNLKDRFFSPLAVQHRFQPPTKDELRMRFPILETVTTPKSELPSTQHPEYMQRQGGTTEPQKLSPSILKNEFRTLSPMRSLLGDKINELTPIQRKAIINRTERGPLKGLKKTEAVKQLESKFPQHNAEFIGAKINFLQFYDIQAAQQAISKPSVAPGRPDAALPPSPQTTRLDFHQIISSLGDYPELMKRLGIRLDFRAKIDRPIQPEGLVRARPVEFPEIQRHVLSPKTRYTAVGGFFTKSSARETNLQEIVGGLLALGQLPEPDPDQDPKDVLPVFDIVPGDIDGFVRKTQHLADCLFEPTQPDSRIKEACIFPLRSAGLALAHRNRGDWLSQSLDESKSKLNSLLPVSDVTAVFSTENLVRGYRIDVRELSTSGLRVLNAGAWRSLCFRKGHYQLVAGRGDGSILNKSFLVTEDEGWIALGINDPSKAKAVPTNGQPPDKPLIVTESLFRWTGWSLCAPRPGKAITDQGVSSGSDSLQHSDSPLHVTMSPLPGTLPRLRFGRQYQFRARAVDLAGNSLSLTEASDPSYALTAPNDGYYDRFEPISSPNLVLTQPTMGPKPQKHPLLPGESVAHIAIRSLNLETKQDISAHNANKTSLRHVLPPKISQELAEAHGMFDEHQSGKVMGSQAYRMMVSKDATFNEVHPERELTVPYLPDPMAAGVTFHNLPGTAGPDFLFTLPFSGNWPDRRSFRLQLEEGSGVPVFENGTLRVFLPKGEQVKVQVSCSIPPGQERLLCIWRWIEEELSKGDHKDVSIDSLRTLVQQGRHWMITPYRELLLAHAVQQPVFNPQWQSLTAPVGYEQSTTYSYFRRMGDYEAYLYGAVAVHRGSTEKFHLEASWSDFVDEGVLFTDPSQRKQANMLACEVVVNLEPPGSPLTETSQGKSDVVLRPEIDVTREASTTREKISSHENAVMQPTPPPSPTQPATPPSEEPPKPPAGLRVQGELEDHPRSQAQPQVQARRHPITFPLPPYDESKHRCAPATQALPSDLQQHLYTFVAKHVLPDTKYHCISYTAVASTRYREYFLPLPGNEPPSQGPKWTRNSPPIKVDILNSVRPDTPHILYVLPTFKWEKSPQGNRRIGGGLRVYLDRPWYSSGNGEQLAVVLFPENSTEIPPFAQSQVSQWGLDPLWVLSPAPAGSPVLTQRKESDRPATSVGAYHPLPGNFVNAVEVRNLELRDTPLPEGVNSFFVTVCAFEVKPDVARQLWYCDIEIDPGKAYYPFIRLALARYQPNSIYGAHLSRVVLTDFAQLIPERSTSVSPNPKAPNSLLVAVKGVRANVPPMRTARVEAVLEEANIEGAGDLAWGPVPNGVIPLESVDETQWMASVPLPTASQGKQRRIVIKEYEVFSQLSEADSVLRTVEERLVYADVISVIS